MENVPIPRKGDSDIDRRHPITEVFEYLGIHGVKPRDEFKLTYRDQMLEASVKRPSGKCETIRKHVRKGAFKEMRTFDPTRMSKDERNELIRKMHGQGYSQSQLANMFGISQPMVSRIVRD